MQARLFKAICDEGEYEGKWVYGYLSDWEHINTGRGNNFRIDPDTICRNTQSLSWGDAEIFEGDILDWNGEESGSVIYSAEEGSFMLKLSMSSIAFSNLALNTWKNIGNIHDKIGNKE